MSKDKQNDKTQKTSKSRRETAVQGTNDSSIVSKCSMATLGYFDDNFLQCFVSKITRRAPLIHRGYYIRAMTLDRVLKRFIERHPGKKQIVSLGAGFDSTYFRLKSHDLLCSVLFFEVDFPEVVKRKAALIRSQSQLNDLVGEPCLSDAQKSSLIEMSSPGYKLLGVDLGQLNTLEAVLKLCTVDFDCPTLVLSECVLTYMTRRCSSAVVKWAAETFTNAVFVLYEQINPSDSFGLFMKNHFTNIGSPLKCIDSFPTLQSQKLRFQKLGWQDTEAIDMNQSYCHLVDEVEHDRIEHLEPFDEHEEWHLKCAHYMVLCGYHGNCSRLLNDVCHSVESDVFGDDVQKLEISEACLELQPCVSSVSPLKRFGHGSVVLGDYIVLTVGGFGEQNGKHMRVKDISLTDIVTMETTTINSDINNKDIEVSRMHATISSIEDGSLLLIGGRISPMRLCTQIVRIQLRNVSQNSCSGNSSLDSHDNKSERASPLLGCLSVNSEVDCKRCKEWQTTKNNSDDRQDDVCMCSVAVENSAGSEDSDMSKCHQMNCTAKSDENKPVMVSDHFENAENLNNQLIVQDNCESAECNTLPEKLVNSREEMRIVCQNEKTAVECTVVPQLSDQPCPRWRHSAVVCKTVYGESVIVFGGRTQLALAVDDCYIYTPPTNTWIKVETKGEVPLARQSHTASVWGGHMIIAGGLGIDAKPLDSIFMLNLETFVWTRSKTTIQPRYSHTAHVVSDKLILIGGVSFSHTPPGVAVVDLMTSACTEIPLSVQTKDSIYMLHRHTSVALGNNRILILGGGGNCFSFGTHLNSSPFTIDLSEVI